VESSRVVSILRRNDAIGGIALPNAASVALHEKLGFKNVVHYEEVGRKFGQ
jgi:phosphinothricin acetyltransferase